MSYNLERKEYMCVYGHHPEGIYNRAQLLSIYLAVDCFQVISKTRKPLNLQSSKGGFIRVILDTLMKEVSSLLSIESKS